MNKKSVVTIVIPVFNEEKNLEELIQRCVATGQSMKHPFEIILVDDGSRDHSAEIIKMANQKLKALVMGVFLNKNYGQHTAVMAGFSYARGDIIVTMDADLQNPPEIIPEFVKKIEEGYDVVGGVRMSRQDKIFRRVASSIVNKFVQWSTGIKMRDYGCMQRAYTRNIIQAMLQCREHSTFIPILANNFAYKTAEIEIRHERRSKGGSKYSFVRLVNLLFDLLTCMTTFPLRVLSIVGILISAFGFLLGFFILLMRLVYGQEWAVEGIFTLFAILFIFIGAQFIGLGLIGEYIGRIYTDVRARPQYLVREVVGQRHEEFSDFSETKSLDSAL